ncbi:DUF4129 domain-containing protein [Bacillus sp. JCM 19034]|uniref:DUF4129 domain-containing protein n=1 Tax=Bacillus sp. JCM 19034 TaxID=1481928 RepID=UPI0007820504|nr:DUF4129 domain-containing protein [Bacillus sp. JCM 19034]
MAQARERLAEILEGQEYTVYYEDNRGFLERTIERIWIEFINFIADMLPNLSPSSQSANYVVIVLVLLGAAALIVIFLLLVRYYSQKRRYRNLSPFQTEDAMKWSSNMHFEEMKVQERKGDYTSALRHLFLGLLLYFHDISWLEARIWKTNWEYVEELKKVNRETAALFHDVALIFDRVTYGKLTVEQEQFEKYKEMVMSWLHSYNEKQREEE